MTKKFLFAFLCLFFVILSNPGYGNVAFYHNGIDEGLNEPRINDIVQDSSGFIWLAGNYSLTRFDGETFIEFVHTTQKPLPWNRINKIYIDSEGILWVASDRGLSFYNTKRNEFRSPGSGWESINITDIAENSNQQLILATIVGLASFDKSTKELVWLTGPNSVFKANGDLKTLINFSYIDCDQQNNVWLSTYNNGLFRFNIASGNLKAFEELDGFQLNDLHINHLAIKKGKLFLATTNRGFLEMDIKRQQIRQFKFDVPLTAQHFHISSDSIIWIASDNGLIRLNTLNETFTRFTNIPTDPLSMIRTAISHVLVDNNNNLWISNGFRGIDFGLNNILFNHLIYSEESPYTVNEATVTSVNNDNGGNLWVGYESGLIEKNSPGETAKQKYYLISPETGNSSGSVFKVFQDSKGRIWAGGWLSGLFQFNNAQNKFVKATIKPNRLANLLENADIRDILEDGNGNLWITIHGLGIAKYNPENMQTQLYALDVNDLTKGPSNNYTYDLCFDNNSNLWISSAHGLSRMDIQEEQFTVYFHNPDDSLSLSSNVTTAVISDKSGNLWVATDNGLVVYIPELNKFQQIPTGRENSFLNITALESVTVNEIWASSESGILKLEYHKNRETNLFDFETEYFFPDNGLASNVYFSRSSTSLGNTIYFGGNGGIDYFNPVDSKRKNYIPPKPVITETSVYGEPVYRKAASGDNADLVLTHDQKMISFRFAAPDFVNARQQSFRYMLDDFDEQWVFSRNEQVATYTNLPNGRYTFKVEVTDKDGNWISSSENHLSLYVKPPFWQTIPFILFIVLLAILLFYLVQRLRYRSMIKRQHRLEQQVKERTSELSLSNKELIKANQTKNKFFSIISHDLRSPFSGLLGILEILSETNNLPEKKQNELLKSAYKTAENTFQLLENLLIWSHSQTDKLDFNPESFDLSEKLKKNIQLSQQQAEQKEIKLNSDFKAGMKAFGDPNMIDTVIRNLLNNAIKFTNKDGKISVITTEDAQNFTVSISDTGIGMTQDQIEHLFDVSAKSKPGTNGESGTGLGLVLVKEFVTKNKGEIRASENHPQGTTFHFTIPKSKE